MDIISFRSHSYRTQLEALPQATLVLWFQFTRPRRARLSHYLKPWETTKTFQSSRLHKVQPQRLSGSDAGVEILIHASA